MFQKRRAVGGLISLIGIVIVFGITSAAYIQINSSQNHLINTSIITSQKISERNTERLNFTSITPNGNNFDVTVENLSADSVTIHSAITKNGNSLVSKKIIDQKIASGQDTEIVGVSGTVNTGDQIIFVTELGKKCLVPEGVDYRLC